MPRVILINGKDRASFTWVENRTSMDVVLDVKEMRNSHTGRMTKEAARLLWKLLKSKGYE